MALTEQLTVRAMARDAGQGALLVPFRLLHAVLNAPAALFLVTLAAMLFRPPDLDFYHLDRIALVALLSAVFLRALILRQPLWLVRPVTWPMFGLFLLALLGVLAEPYVPEQWSVFAAKWVVPFLFYHLAELVFEEGPSSRQFETFCLVVLAYLCLIAILFVVGAKSLIFPRYILDESLGIHADRARGPFLQAVANGVSLNILGLLALNAYRRGRLRGPLALFFLGAVPLSILATKTRAVWLSFVGAGLILLVLSAQRRVRRACLWLAAAGVAGLVTVLAFTNAGDSLRERAAERSPVDFRVSLYRAGWAMFLERPLLGWGAHSTQAEVTKRMNDFHQESFVFHNAYLEVVVEHGLLGLGLYAWVLLDLFRVGRRRRISRPTTYGFLDSEFRAIWPVLVGIYVVNACFVVMNYQFVNGLLFTLAGMLSAQNRRQDALELNRGRAC